MKTLNVRMTMTRNAALALPLMIVALTGCAGGGSFSPVSATPAASRSLTTEHVMRAKKVASTVTPAENEYTDQNLRLEIETYDGFTLSKNRSECASFVTMLLKQSYSLTDADITAKFGYNTNSPWAYQYHDKIAASPALATTPVAGQTFSRISKISQVEEGDLLALRYYNGTRTSSTGHLMVVVTLPVKQALQDTLNGTTTDVYDIEVVDSTNSPHGDADKRKINNDTGVGFGVFRVYVNPVSEEIVAHKWSPKANDGTYRFYQVGPQGTMTRHLEIGRFLTP